MSLAHPVTCGDLAALGGRWDRLHQHDPRKMEIGVDTPCFCHDGPSVEARTCRYVECEEQLRIPVGEEYVLVLCCLCQSEVRGAERGIRDEDLHRWLLAECEEALRYREKRRLAPGPTVADMEWRAAVLATEAPNA